MGIQISKTATLRALRYDGLVIEVFYLYYYLI